MAPTFTEELIQQIAPDGSSLSAGRNLRKVMKDLGVSADGTWLLGKCQGSAKDPYVVSVDLVNPSAPVGRCTCPSRKYPCKHAIGLLYAYLDRADKFATREPDADTLAKREKQVARAEKATQRDKDGASAGPRKVNLAALAKKTKQQRDGLDLLEKLLNDMVSGGQWFEKSRLSRLENQSKQMSDHYLPGAMVMLRRVVLLGREDEVSEEERIAGGTELVGRLWAMVKQGRNYLDEKLAGDESQAEADAVMEEVLGKAWQLTELREKGYFRDNLDFYELAWEKVEDEARQERIETSHLIDLSDGKVYQAIAYRPYKAMGQRTQPSYQQPVHVNEAAVYPGFHNRRVRWDPSAESLQPMAPATLKKVYGFAAAEFEPVLAELRKQLKHPLAPRQIVVLLRCARVGRVGQTVAIEDARGMRIETADRQKGDYNVANLLRAAGELRKQPALLARLFVRPLTNTIVAQPLALLSADKHLRLGI
ncbi:MAG: SWIM zinc finger domain-containing protein [Gemmataceae bacterium]|nr:SWIM zinc finger domain-containing protein [Gemmataceae bacterium]